MGEFIVRRNMGCIGTKGDDKYGSIRWNFKGSLQQCKAECARLERCTGFLRNKPEGKCVFKGGPIVLKKWNKKFDCYRGVAPPSPPPGVGGSISCAQEDAIRAVLRRHITVRSGPQVIRA